MFSEQFCQSLSIGQSLYCSNLICKQDRWSQWSPHIECIAVPKRFGIHRPISKWGYQYVPFAIQKRNYFKVSSPVRVCDKDTVENVYRNTLADPDYQ